MFQKPPFELKEGSGLLIDVGLINSTLAKEYGNTLGDLKDRSS